MTIEIEISEQELKDLIKDHLESLFNTNVKPMDIKILVKSKQNYKSEWEVADFKACYKALRK